MNGAFEKVALQYEGVTFVTRINPVEVAWQAANADAAMTRMNGIRPGCCMLARRFSFLIVPRVKARL